MPSDRAFNGAFAKPFFQSDVQRKRGKPGSRGYQRPHNPVSLNPVFWKDFNEEKATLVAYPGAGHLTCLAGAQATLAPA